MPKGGIGHGHGGGMRSHGAGHHHIGHGHGGGFHHGPNHHLHSHTSYNRTHCAYGPRPGPVIIYAGVGAAVWRPRHRTFQSEMRMWIEIQNNQVNFKVGDWVQGRVLCNFKEPFDTQVLLLQFMGFESTWIQRKGHETDIKYEFHNQTWQLWSLPKIQWSPTGPVVTAGQYIHPFEFQIPMNLPPSIFHKMGDVRLDYRIRAQFVPHLANDWVDPDATLSCLRANDYYLQIARPFEPIIQNPDYIYRYNLKTQAHTFLGLGGITETNTDFEFTQGAVQQGGKLRVRIICDNSHCKKDVDNIILRFYCMTTFRDTLEARQHLPGFVTKSQPINMIKFPIGLKSGMKLDKTYDITVPIVKIPSIQVSLFTIAYIVECQTNHDVFGKRLINEKTVFHPVVIQVVPPATIIQLDQQYVLTQQQLPPEWTPNQFAPMKLNESFYYTGQPIQQPIMQMEETKEQFPQVQSQMVIAPQNQQIMQPPIQYQQPPQQNMMQNQVMQQQVYGGEQQYIYQPSQYQMQEPQQMVVNSGQQPYQQPPQQYMQINTMQTEYSYQPDWQSSSQQQFIQPQNQTQPDVSGLPPQLQQRMLRGSVSRDPGVELAQMMGPNAILQQDQINSSTQIQKPEEFHLMAPQEKENYKVQFAKELKEIQEIYPANQDAVLELLVQYQGNVQFVIQHIADQQ